MALPSFLPEFFQQCCDAGSYLEIGSKCALHNNCYDETRPGGVGYWFSIPTRLGLSNNALIYANLLLLLLSVLLFYKTMQSFSSEQRAASSEQRKNSPLKIAFLTILILIHVVFYLPTIFTSLSDTPSSLLLLNGIWFLLLAKNKNNITNIVLITVGAVMIGMATWIRSFYFYPLLASTAIASFCFIFLPRKYKKFSHCLIFLALLCPSIQILHTYKVTGKIAYMNTSASNAWTEIHLNSKDVGYDTVLPALPMYSNANYCSINSGLLPSLHERNYSSLSCLFFNRALFYLSTYEHLTYLDQYSPKNKLFSETTEDVGDDKSWLTRNIEILWNISKDPLGGTTADRMTVAKDNSRTGAYTVQWATLPQNTEYTFSVWLWSDSPSNIEIAFSHHGSGALIAKKIASVSSQPQRFFVSGKTSDANDYSVSIGNMPFTNDNTEKPLMPTSFYAWGAQLETGSTMTEYVGSEKPNPDVLRPKHMWLLTLNLVAIFAALTFLFRIREILLTHPTHLFAVSLIIFSFAEALIIIPEQRFLVACMIFIWSLAAAELFSRVNRRAPQVS